MNTQEMQYYKSRFFHNSLLVLVLLLTQASFSQDQSFDITRFKIPKGFKKELKDDKMVLSGINNLKKTWCQIVIYKSTTGFGSLERDFDSGWVSLVRPMGVIETPGAANTSAFTNYKVKTAGAAFRFNNQDAVVTLNSFSGDGFCVYIRSSCNSQEFYPAIQAFSSSFSITAPAKTNIAPPPAEKSTASVSSKYRFTQTNFDDGWVSSVKDNWVEVTKNALKVKIHYPDKKADQYFSVLKDGDINAWNLLVAPYYNQVKNFSWRTIQSYESITFIEADAVELSSGRLKHIVLFKKHYSNGNGRFLEFVTDTRAACDNEFGPYHEASYDWDKYANMQFRNKFAVTASDLLGTWTTNDYASLTYYYVSTGQTAGTTTTSTSDQFTFLTGNNYTSEHAGASGQVGNMKFSSQTYKGKSTVTDWSLTLTNRFQGATENYTVRFEAVKGGRILIMTDRLGTTWNLVKKTGS